jgi:rhodanese-related sulfurtransferase
MMNQITIFVSLLLSVSFVTGQNGIYAELTALQCDSLVRANKNNANFVILDVRTPAEYKPKHLEGAINRNYYETFDNKLDSLDKNKRYLLHCQSGSRSAGAFAKMKTKNFREVYNLKGGISAWSNANLPTTALFAPKLMFFPDTNFAFKHVYIGSSDTIKVTITNRANDTLTFDAINLYSTSEFSTDFNLDTTLLGAEDYSFNIIYTPIDTFREILGLTIRSNGGTEFVKIYRTGVISSSTIDEPDVNFTLYPNPAFSDLYIQTNSDNNDEYLITDINGVFVKRIKVFRNSNEKSIDISDLRPGVYFVHKRSSEKKAIVNKFIKAQ